MISPLNLEPPGVLKLLAHTVRWQIVAALAQSDDIALANRVGKGGDALVGRPVDRDFVTLNQLLNPTGVIAVVMGDQDGNRLQAILLQPLDYRLGIARVNNGHMRIIPAADEPDIIVVKGVDASNFQHGHKPVRLWRIESPLYTR